MISLGNKCPRHKTAKWMADNGQEILLVRNTNVVIKSWGKAEKTKSKVCWIFIQLKKTYHKLEWCFPKNENSRESLTTLFQHNLSVAVEP